MSNLEFNKLQFDRWYNGVYSAYTLVTFHNVMDLFTLVLKTSPYYAVFLIPIFVIWIFFVLTFIIGMLNHYFVRVVRQDIKGLPNYTKFKKVFNYFSNDKGIVEHWQIEEFIRDFFKNPESIDFGKYEDVKRVDVHKNDSEKRQFRETYCWLIRQHETLSTVQTDT